MGTTFDTVLRTLGEQERAAGILQGFLYLHPEDLHRLEVEAPAAFWQHTVRGELRLRGHTIRQDPEVPEGELRFFAEDPGPRESTQLDPQDAREAIAADLLAELEDLLARGALDVSVMLPNGTRQAVPGEYTRGPVRAAFSAFRHAHRQGTRHTEALKDVLLQERGTRAALVEAEVRAVLAQERHVQAKIRGMLEHATRVIDTVITMYLKAVEAAPLPFQVLVGNSPFAQTLDRTFRTFKDYLWDLTSLLQQWDKVLQRSAYPPLKDPPKETP